jgi:hypothetical protein
MRKTVFLARTVLLKASANVLFIAIEKDRKIVGLLKDFGLRMGEESLVPFQKWTFRRVYSAVTSRRHFS